MLASLVRTLLAFGLALAFGTTCRAALGEWDLPGDLSVTPMTQGLRLNGLPLQIELLASSMAPRQACAAVAERWARSHRAALPGCRQSGDWLLASVCLGSQELTVQLRPASTGSRGYLSIIDLRARPTKAPVPRVPMPLGARVRNVLQSFGPEGETAQFTIGMPASPRTALRRLTEYASRTGWKLGAPPQPWIMGGTFELRRGDELARGLLTREGAGSGLVLVERTGHARRP